MNGKLYVVGTPIGNLSDFSPRAIETLRNVDFIAAEDTRVTLKLLNKFEIKTPMISYHEHNMRERGEFVCKRIENGENCAIVTDAGMPAVSDPGEKLVMQCAERGIEVSVVPGPTAMASALAISGLPTGRFTFEGFLSMNKKSRHEHLLSLRNEHRTMVFYEDSGNYQWSYPEITVTMNHDNVFLPYPEADVIQNPLLNRNLEPQPYY